MKCQTCKVDLSKPYYKLDCIVSRVGFKIPKKEMLGLDPTYLSSRQNYYCSLNCIRAALDHVVGTAYRRMKPILGKSIF